MELQEVGIDVGALAKARNVEVGVLDVAAYGEIGAVELQQDAGPGDLLVLVARDVGDSAWRSATETGPLQPGVLRRDRRDR